MQMNKLKVKWGVESNWQLILIFFVFSITGSLSVYVKVLIFSALGIDKNTSLFLIVPLYLITIIPIYYVILLIVGTFFGQYQFFLSFEKKSLSRIFLRKKSAKSSNYVLKSLGQVNKKNV